MTRKYKKSTRSGGSGGDCVEWAIERSEVWVRDSKDPDGPELTMSHAEWARLVDAVVAGTEHPWVSGTQIVKGGVVLTFTRAEWDAFTAGARAGECLAVAR